jgi:hypothetical protein
MAKPVRGRPRKIAGRKSPAPGKRKVAKSGVASGKIRALVYNLSASELDELIRIAAERKNEQLVSAKASFLDEVKARAATLGMSLADLVGLGNGKAAGNQPPAAAWRPFGSASCSGYRQGWEVTWPAGCERSGRARIQTKSSSAIPPMVFWLGRWLQS